MVWRDNNGKPGEVMYSQPDQLVAYSDNLLGFHTYMLKEPLQVNGVFYIGWEQQTGDNLNLGYDRYNDAQQDVFYNSTGEWFQSTFHGALMMRPMLGDKFEMIGVDENEVAEGSILPYPNPLDGSRIGFRCSGRYLENDATERLTVSIFGVPGEKVFEGRFESSINAGNLAPGLYIIRITDPTGQVISTSKLIKQ
jgi:hypothetical protein